MDTAKIGPALDLGRIIRMKERLVKENAITDEEKQALHRMIMSCGKAALESLE